MARYLDEMSTEGLDRVTRLAARALQAPAAVLSLRDGADHLLASSCGLPAEWQERRGEPLDDAVPAAACAPGSGGVVAVADVRATPQLRAGAVVAAADAVACVAVALRDGAGAAVGALWVLDVRVRAWTAQERALLEELAGLAALERARAVELRERAALRRVATAVAHGDDPDAVAALVAEQVGRAYGAEAGIVVRYDDASCGTVVGGWACDPQRRVPAGATLRVDDGGIGQALRRAPSARADGGPGHVPFRYRAGAAITGRGGPWGFVGALTSRAPFAEGVERRLEAFAELVAAAIRSAETRAQLAAQATTDPLTGLPNKRVFEERMAGEVERAIRHGRNLALALLDLDGFKLVNNTHGHRAGDQALVTVARRAAATVRAGELLARVGGDELALLLPEADADEAHAAAERIRQLIAHENGGALAGVTVSAGVSDLALGGDGDGLLRTADEALYWAKGQGRDVVVRYRPELEQALGSDERAHRVAHRQALLGIGALARSIDARDVRDRHHHERVAELAVRLARASGWPPQRLALLREAALVHDVGKVGIAEEVLRARSPSPAQRAQLREHARLGAEIAARVLTPEQVAWIRSHHERPDGRGYPDGLVGDAIPPGARLLAVADAWVAMTSPSREGGPLPPAAALAEFRAGAGVQFAADAVGALERVLASGELGPVLSSRPAISLGA